MVLQFFRTMAPPAAAAALNQNSTHAYKKDDKKPPSPTIYQYTPDDTYVHNTSISASHPPSWIPADIYYTWIDSR